MSSTIFGRHISKYAYLDTHQDLRSGERNGGWGKACGATRRRRKTARAEAQREGGTRFGVVCNIRGERDSWGLYSVRNRANLVQWSVGGSFEKRTRERERAGVKFFHNKGVLQYTDTIYI